MNEYKKEIARLENCVTMERQILRAIAKRLIGIAVADLTQCEVGIVTELVLGGIVQISNNSVEWA